MALFRKAEVIPAFLKMGIYGEPGSGKTFTASQIAKGLALLIGKGGQKPPVMFLDTETGATWVRPILEDAGIEFLVHGTRSFQDLKQAVVEAQEAGAILIVDSMTHFWEEIRHAYLAAKRKRLKSEHARLELPDWNVIKPEWGKFTSLYLNSKCHIILCGRAGNVYEFQENEETHKKEMITSGTRMAAEKGMGYEPNLLVEMTSRQMGSARKGKTIVRTATVLKDRSDVLDGQQFEDPTFESFLPHIQRLNLGGKHSGFDDSRTSEALFPTEGGARDSQGIRRDICLDEIQALMVKHHPSTSGEDKKAKAALLAKYFHTTSWTEVEKLMPLVDLQAHYNNMHCDLEGQPSRYGVKVAAPTTDEIPRFDEPDKKADNSASGEPQKAQQLQAKSACNEPDKNPDNEPNDLDTIIHDFEAAVTKEADATKRKALWDATTEYRDAMSEAQLAKIKGAYGRALMSPNGKPGRGTRKEAA